MIIEKIQNGNVLIKTDSGIINHVLPSAMIVQVHPREDDAIMVSKTPTNQDEEEGLVIYISEVSKLVGDDGTQKTFSGNRNSLMQTLAKDYFFNTGGGDGIGVAEYFGSYTDSGKNDILTAMRVDNIKVDLTLTGGVTAKAKTQSAYNVAYDLRKAFLYSSGNTHSVHGNANEVIEIIFSEPVRLWKVSVKDRAITSAFFKMKTIELMDNDGKQSHFMIHTTAVYDHPDKHWFVLGGRWLTKVIKLSGLAYNTGNCGLNGIDIHLAVRK